MLTNEVAYIAGGSDTGIDIIEAGKNEIIRLNYTMGSSLSDPKLLRLDHKTLIFAGWNGSNRRTLMLNTETGTRTELPLMNTARNMAAAGKLNIIQGVSVYL